MEKLLAIQQELRVPKKVVQGKEFKSRNAEEIMAALKPLLAKHKCAAYINDEILAIAGRVYVKATVSLIDLDGRENKRVSAYAREPEFEIGMSDAQVTGSSSSYAAKYALGKMFLIDDGIDPDNTVAATETKSYAQQDQTQDEATTWKSEIDAIDDLGELKKYYEPLKSRGGVFGRLVANRVAEIKAKK